MSQTDMDQLAKRINNVYKEPGSSTGMVTMLNNVNFSQCKLKKKTTNKPWFTKECGETRKLLYSAKHKHRKLQTEASEAKVRSCGKKYKLEIKKATKLFNNKNHKKIRAL